MESHRIILAGVPRFVREMLEGVLRQIPGMWIAHEPADSTALPATIARTGAQWVVLPLDADGRMPARAQELLAACPSVRLLAVSDDGSRVRGQWLELHEEIWDDLSLDDLIAIIHEQRRQSQ